MDILITGINGHLGSYLAEHYLEKGFDVIGTIRRSSTDTLQRIKTIVNDLELCEMDLTDKFNVHSVLTKYKPERIVNTAAQSHVATSFEQPTYTTDVNCGGVYNILEWLRYNKETKLVQLSTSEMFGNQTTLYGGKHYQSEDTLMVPNSPYAIAKLAAHNAVNLYRRAYGVHGKCLIAFNYESPRRGENFVTRKITKWIGQFLRWQSRWSMLNWDVKYNFADPDNIRIVDDLNHSTFPKLRLGNIDSMRDWSHTKDVVQAIDLLMECNGDTDYVVGSGETHTVRDFLSTAFEWAGLGKDYEPYICIDKSLYRPVEVPMLRAKADLIRLELGWRPEYDFRKLVNDMVDCDS